MALPAIVETSFHLSPLIDSLWETLGRNGNIVKAVRTTPLLLWTNILSLKNRGVPDGSGGERFSSSLDSPVSQEESSLERKIGIFKCFGWSDDDILDMLLVTMFQKTEISNC
ncbi:hypothetical protein RND71_024397 [Anisodus tanguticus]|uniref:Uncharacterized protein n=1 Tax=Anisodus tanguticus TaxID=243964 RepID=A0AAE1RPJ7_9SOLA|nr:hypothetical protein RND71_024397 [Anisodus tanguticus]